MIDFELTDGDKEVIALARRQAIGYQQRAKGIDRTMEFDRPDFAEQFAFAGQEDIVHVRDFAQERADDLSGLTIIEPLIYLEESYGFKPLFWQGDNADAMNVSLSGKLIEKVGTPEQVEAFQPLYLAWGMSEPNGGSDPASMRTVATYDAATDEWVINGEKIFSSNATHADGILVMCRAVGPDGDEGISLFVVTKGMPGYGVGPQMDKLGLRNWDTVATFFMDVRVPALNRLQGNLKDALSIFNGTRALIAGQALGYARVALDLVREKYAEGGKALNYAGSLASRSAIEDRILGMEALWDATYLTMLHAKWHEQARGPGKFYPSLAKCKAGLMVRKLINDCMDILGPESASEKLPVEQALRDARILDIYEGPNEAQRLLMARTLLNYSAKELN
ncbi:acyl-CoA dehydrogenase [Sphingomonas sp. YL-JM2C]